MQFNFFSNQAQTKTVTVWFLQFSTADYFSLHEWPLKYIFYGIASGLKMHQKKQLSLFSQCTTDCF
jgi:hypothetical protein